MTVTHAKPLADDGTSLFSTRTGTGAPLVLTNGLTTTTNFWKYLLPAWQAQRQTITWDLPGHGQSGPAQGASSASIRGLATLLATVMDAWGIERATHIGWSTGCQVLLEFYRLYPQRCDGLGLLLGTAGNVLSTATLPLPGNTIRGLARYTPSQLLGACARVTHSPLAQPFARATGLIGKGTSHLDANEILRHIPTLHFRTVQRMVLAADDHSAWDMLGTIQVPVRVVVGAKDPFAPADTVGERLASAIPNAALLRLPEGTHTALLDHPGPILEFLTPLTGTP